MKRNTIILIIIAGVLLLPWLGLPWFNSKGEPREAIVAVSMLNSGDWILPTSCGGDIPYKPPLLAWLIALFSEIFNGGVVSTWTARLPSALSAIFLVIFGWKVMAPRIGRDRAWMTFALTLTSFELFRAAIACRVDMVLTACIVGACYSIYLMYETDGRRRWGYALAAILLLSGGVFTKGPVGALLPLLAMGIYRMLCRDNVLRTAAVMLGLLVASLLLPALWYYAAYLRGGDEFVRLALEENIGRLTGTMSYDSHVNPWWYNFVTLLWGVLPWTIPALMALCLRRVRTATASAWRNRDSKPNLTKMAWTVALTVLIFYCIPSSKRSVYLLPMYPFIAMGLSWLLWQCRTAKFMRIFTRVLALLAIIAPIALTILSHISLGHLRIYTPTWWQYIMTFLPVIAGVWWLVTRSREANAAAGAVVIAYLLFLSYASTFAPMLLNPKSDRPAAEAVARQVPKEALLYGVITGDSLLRYYTINYYLNDRMNHATNLDAVPHDAYVVTDPQAVDNRPDYIVLDTLTSRSCDTRTIAVLAHRE